MSDKTKTIPNTITFSLPKKIRFTIKVLKATSHNLLFKFLDKLFKTPLKYTPQEREIMFRKSAKEQLVFIPSMNKNVMVYTYGYSQKKVLFVHGWSGRGTQFYKIADKLLENGMMIISFDAPAHGQSDTKKTMMSEFTAVVNELYKINKGFYAAIGHSLGAMSLLKNVANGLKIDKLVSISATNKIDEILITFFNGLKLDKKLIPKFKRYFKQKNNVYVDEFNAGEYAKHISIPTLIIHDSTDVPTSVSNAFEIRQNLLKGELLVTYGNGHTRILKSKKVVNRIALFLSEK